MQPADKKKLLIVDDEENIRKLFGMIVSFEFPDVMVDTAANGLEAFEKFKTCHAGMLLMDLRMPVMNGFEAFQAIRNHCTASDWQMPCVLFCTGFNPSPDVKEVTKDGFPYKLLLKPVTSDVVTNSIREMLDRMT